MPETIDVDRLRNQLFTADGDEQVFAVLDAASVPSLPKVLWKQKPENVCLWKGELSPELIWVAPYLVRLEPKSRITDWVLEIGWGHHWGIFAIAPAHVGFRELRNHFRNFLTVRAPNGKVLEFRYYDPRVFRVYLPTCNAAELRTVFGPVSTFVMEDEDASSALRFWRHEGALRQQRDMVGEVTS